MEKYAISVLMLLICTAAQPIANAETVKVHVPYDFMAAGVLLHAGTYGINRQDSGNALRLTNVDRKESGLFLLPTTSEFATSDRVTLRFERIGNLYILSAIQTPEVFCTFAPDYKAVRTALKQSAASSAGQ